MDVKEIIKEALDKWMVSPSSNDEFEFAESMGYEFRYARAFYAGYQAALFTLDPEAIKRACRKGCPECEDGSFDLISDTGIGFCKICGGIAQIPQGAAILQSSPADQGPELKAEDEFSLCHGCYVDDKQWDSSATHIHERCSKCKPIDGKMSKWKATRVSKPAQDEGKPEVAWLVEWSTPGWTDGIVRWHRYIDQKTGSLWTTDASLATRYSRKEDAEGWIRSMGYDKAGDMIATEHQWC